MHRVDPSLREFLKPIKDFKRDPENRRKHEKQSLDAIKDSLLAHGQRKLIVADMTGVIVAGNGTHEAAEQLGWDEAAIVMQNFKDADERTEFAIRDNQTATKSEWDQAGLHADLARLVAKGTTLESLAFPPDFLNGAPIPANLPADPDEEEDDPRAPPVRKAVIGYNIIFDSMEQQQAFFDYLRWLKGAFPNEPTIGGRLRAHLTQVVAP